MLIHIYIGFIIFLIGLFTLHSEYAKLLAEFEEENYPDANISNQESS